MQVNRIWNIPYKICKVVPFALLATVAYSIAGYSREAIEFPAHAQYISEYISAAEVDCFTDTECEDMMSEVERHEDYLQGFTAQHPIAY